MTRQKDLKDEERQRRKDAKLIRAVEFDLKRAVEHSGGILHGVAITFYPEDVFIVVKAEVSGRKQVCFIETDTAANGLRKVVRDGFTDRLRWRRDIYAKDDN